MFIQALDEFYVALLTNYGDGRCGDLTLEVPFKIFIRISIEMSKHRRFVLGSNHKDIYQIQLALQGGNVTIRPDPEELKKELISLAKLLNTGVLNV